MLEYRLGEGEALLQDLRKGKATPVSRTTRPEHPEVVAKEEDWENPEEVVEDLQDEVLRESMVA